MRLRVYVRKPLRPACDVIGTTRVNTGLGGHTPNKGGCIIALRVAAPAAALSSRTTDVGGGGSGGGGGDDGGSTASLRSPPPQPSGGAPARSTTIALVSCHLTAHEGAKMCESRNDSIAGILEVVRSHDVPRKDSLSSLTFSRLSFLFSFSSSRSFRKMGLRFQTGGTTRHTRGIRRWRGGVGRGGWRGGVPRAFEARSSLRRPGGERVPESVARVLRG